MRQRWGCDALVFLNPYAKQSAMLTNGERLVHHYHVNKEWGGARPIEGCPSFRHACEGGMHHAAAALGVRGVVIYGGWISPGLSGYACHDDNVYRGG